MVIILPTKYHFQKVIYIISNTLSVVQQMLRALLYLEKRKLGSHSYLCGHIQC